MWLGVGQMPYVLHENNFAQQTHKQQAQIAYFLFFFVFPNHVKKHVIIFRSLVW